MSQKSPMLSICIPTYNRVGYLKELLPGVLAQAVVGGVEIVVSDNASTDGTAEYLRSICDQNLRWWTNDANIGGDSNFLKCVGEARGEYVWLFGDDDIMPSGSVERVIGFLNNNRVCLLVSDDQEDRVSCEVYADYQSMLAARGDALALAHTLISSNVFRKDLFDMALATKTLWVQYAHMFGIMSNMPGHAVGVVPGFVKMRPVRAEFDVYPSCLCVKQAVYLWFLAKRFDMPRFRWRAIWNACNLPVEYASRVWNFLKRKTRSTV